MGCSCGKESKKPKILLYPDKFILLAGGIIPLVLGIICIILLYVLYKVECYDLSTAAAGANQCTRDGATVRKSSVDEYCWLNLNPATYSGSWQAGSELPHKIYPILLICESVTLVLCLLIWYWCLGQRLSNYIESVIDQCNNLTAIYRSYDKNMGKKVDGTVLHRQLNNYLEYLAYLVTSKAKRIYILYIIKWVMVICICLGWILALTLMFLPDMNIIQSVFCCLYDTANPPPAVCDIPSSTFFTVTWYINVVLMGIFIIVAIVHLIIDVCFPRRYRDTFFYRCVPGAMDARLAQCIHENHRHRYYTLISRFCDENEHLCDEPGLSKSLAMKYSYWSEESPGDTKRHEHSPALTREQIEKFRLAIAGKGGERKKSKQSKRSHKTIVKKVKIAPMKKYKVPRQSKTSKVYKVHDSRNGSLPMRKGVKGKTGGGETPESNRLEYLTPHLYDREMEKQKTQRSPRAYRRAPFESTVPISDRTHKETAVNEPVKTSHQSKSNLSRQPNENNSSIDKSMEKESVAKDSNRLEYLTPHLYEREMGKQKAQNTPRVYRRAPFDITPMVDGNDEDTAVSSSLKANQTTNSGSNSNKKPITMTKDNVVGNKNENKAGRLEMADANGYHQSRPRDVTRSEFGAGRFREPSPSEFKVIVMQRKFRAEQIQAWK